MASPDVRILAPIPGKSAIGVEVPNRHPPAGGPAATSSNLRGGHTPATHPLEVAMGRDIAGRAVMVNLAEMPHVLISGATGAGQVVLHQLDHHLGPHARATPRGQDDPDRPQAGRAGPVRRAAAPAQPGGGRPQEGGQRAGRGRSRRWNAATTCWPRTGCRDIAGYNQLVDDGLVATPPDDKRRMRDTAAKVLGEDHPAVEERDEPEARPSRPSSCRSFSWWSTSSTTS